MYVVRTQGEIEFSLLLSGQCLVYLQIAFFGDFQWFIEFRQKLRQGFKPDGAYCFGIELYLFFTLQELFQADGVLSASLLCAGSGTEKSKEGHYVYCFIHLPPSVITVFQRVDCQVTQCFEVPER